MNYVIINCKRYEVLTAVVISVRNSVVNGISPFFYFFANIIFSMKSVFLE